MRFLAFVLAISFVAADWPQFLGPNRDSSTKETVKPWTEVPKVLWTKPVGEAHSSPVVAGGIVYAFYREKGKDEANDLETLAAYNAASGAEKWKKSLTRPAFGTLFGSGPQGTPAVALGKVFTFGNSGLLTARDAGTGELVWSVDTLKQFNAKNLRFGISTSPIIVDKNVIVMVGGKDAGIVAFDVANGKVSWKATGDPGSYSSPIVNDGNLTFLTGSHLRGLTAGGQETWSYPFKDRANESSTMPVKVDDWIIASSITLGTVAVKIADKKVEKVWENENLNCFFSTPIVVGKYLYMINGVTGNKALLDPAVNLRCVELATGKLLWEKPKVGSYHAALLHLGDGKLLMHDDKGFLTLFESDPKEYKELARSKVSGITWAHPALVDGKLYLRDNKNLLCFELP